MATGAIEVAVRVQIPSKATTEYRAQLSIGRAAAAAIILPTSENIIDVLISAAHVIGGRGVCIR
jgi:hypothetical protein